MPRPPAIRIVDDDPAIVKSLSRLLTADGYLCIGYDSAESFLAEFDPQRPGCVVLDLGLPGMDGLGIQDALANRGITVPVIFLTGTGDIPASVRAMKCGALDFLTKPVKATDLLSAIDEALRLDGVSRAADAASSDLKANLETLTPRERQVLDLVVLGKQSKQIAAELGTAVKTIKVHRSRMMRKMDMQNLAELVRAMVERDGDKNNL